MKENTARRPLPPRDAKPRALPAAEQEQLHNAIAKGCHAVVSQTYGKGRHKILLLPQAVTELEAMTAFGAKLPINYLEQRFNGYGHIMQDHGGALIFIVKHLIEIQSPYRSPVGVSLLGPNGEPNPGNDIAEFLRETFLAQEADRNQDTAGWPVDPFLKDFGGSEFVLDGHTHPGLGVFWSGPDKGTIQARGGLHPAAAIVVDPLCKDVLGAASFQHRMEPAQVIFYRHPAAQAPAPAAADTPPEQLILAAAAQAVQYGAKGGAAIRTRFGQKTLRVKLSWPAARRAKTKKPAPPEDR